MVTAPPLSLVLPNKAFVWKGLNTASGHLLVNFFNSEFLPVGTSAVFHKQVPLAVPKLWKI